MYRLVLAFRQMIELIAFWLFLMALHLLNTMDEKHGRFTMKTLYVVTTRHTQILIKEIDTQFCWFFFANRCRRLIEIANRRIFIELAQTIFHVVINHLIHDANYCCFYGSDLQSVVSISRPQKCSCRRFNYCAP